MEHQETNQKSNNLLLGIVLGVLTALYFAVKFGSPILIENLYFQDQLDVFNTITQVQEKQSLGFYLGQIEAIIYGPLSMIIAGIIFLVFGLRFLTKASLGGMFLAVFVFLLVTKFEVLFFPPYGDAIGGPFVEAMWLKRHSFDYVGLFHQHIYPDGGPRVYLFTIYPGFLALLMTLISSKTIFLVVNHIIVFGLTAGLVALFREINLKIFDEKTSLLNTALLLFLPLVQAQSEAINMEIPMVFCGIAAIYFLINKRLALAVVMSMLSAMIKVVGIIICAAVIFVMIVMFFMDEVVQKKKRIILYSISLLGFVGCLFYACVYVFHSGGDVQMVGAFAGWPSIVRMEVLYIFFVSLIVFIIHVIRSHVSKYQTQSGRIMYFWDKYYVPIIMATCVFAWVGFMLQSYAVSPRYRLLLAPFTLFWIVYACSLLIKSKKIHNALLIVAIMCSGLFSYGLIYFNVPAHSNYVLLERSLEYRNDLKLYMEIAKEVEEKYSDQLIAAPFLVAQTLALPEIGFVKKDLDVMMYGMTANYGNIKNFSRLSEIDVAKTIWVGLKSSLPPSIEYPISSEDVVIKNIYSGSQRASLFRGGVAIERVRILMNLLQKKNLIKKSHP